MYSSSAFKYGSAFAMNLLANMFEIISNNEE